MIMKKLLVIIVLAALFHGCKIGKNYNGTTVDQPSTFYQQDKASAVTFEQVNTDSVAIDTATVAWWQLYDDPVLDTLIREAFVNNLNAMIAAESVLQARYILNIQNAELLPKFSAAGEASRGNFLFNQQGSTNNLILGSANVFWEIDLWGKLRRQSEAARAQLLASEYGYRGVMISLVSEVATTYFNLLRAKSQYEIASRNAVARDSMLQIIRSRYQEGIVPLLDVDQARIQYAIAAGTVPEYERQIVQFENALSILMGRNPGPVEIGKPLEQQKLQIDIPVGTPVDLLARRPDVLAAEFGVMAQNATAGVARGNRLPTISLAGLVGISGTNFKDLSFDNPLWSITGQVTAPLFYWNQLKRQVDIEDSRTFQALYRYRNTVFGALAEVEDLLANIRTTQTEIEIANERKDASLRAQYLSRERYYKGVTSYLEYLEQQRQALDAELLLESLRARQLSNHVQLYKALGGGWLTEEEQQQVSDRK